MGSFNVSCGVSSIPIVEGERTGVQLLVEKSLPDYRDKESLIMSSTRFYKLLSAPVYGTYDSYGDIIDVEQSCTTTALEEFFHMPIEKLLEAVSDKRSVYDGFGALYEVFMPKDNLFTTFGESILDVFLSVGFEISDEGAPDEHDRGSTVALTFKNTRVFMDDEGITAVYQDDVLLQELDLLPGQPAGLQLGIYADATGLYPGVEEKHYSVLNMIPKLNMMFFNPRIVDDMNTHALKDTFIKSMRTRLEHDIVQYQKFHTLREELYEKSKYTGISDEDRASLQRDTETVFFHAYQQLTRILQDIQSFDNTYYRLHTELRGDDVRNILKLVQVMNQTQHVFMPSLYVSEEDSYDSALALSKITQSILEERKRAVEETPAFQ